jgi:cytochrome o ubiquinol oxidase subunit IV
MNDIVADAPRGGTGDLAPGQKAGGPRGIAAGAVVLTVASFCAAETHLIYGPGVSVALVTLGIAQIGIHLVFFLHLTTAPDNTNNVLALAFGLLIVFFVIVGSLWIMANLNHMSMPMDQLMRMKR